MKLSGHIRSATRADMDTIHAWLPRDRSVGTLAANWHITLGKFHEGAVFVWIDEVSDSPLAYCWGSLNSTDSILEVRPECREQGIGRAMANFMIGNSIADEEPLLEFQIAPTSAEQFWRSMGFETFIERNNCYGRRKLELKRTVSRGITRKVEVIFLPAAADWSEEVPPLASHRLDGFESSTDGTIALERVTAHFSLSHGDDLVVEILVEDQSRYRGKAKYKAARAVGIRPCENGFMIDTILPVHPNDDDE